MTTGIVLPTTSATAQNQGYLPQMDKQVVKRQTGQPTLQDRYNIANTPDSLLESMAKYEAYTEYKNDPTRTATKAAFPTFLVADSFTQGVMKQGSGSAKLATTASTASDWGVFTGAVWLYNKGINKMYDLFPGAAKFREDHPTTAYVGELASSTALGWGAVHVYNQKGGHEFVERNMKKLLDKTPGLSNKAEEIVRPLSDFAKKHKNIVALGYLGAGMVAIGLVAKNIYDVFHAKETADNRYEQLKDQRYQVTKELLDSAIKDKTV